MLSLMEHIQFTYFEAVLYGLVEAITEFLPVSSTGHMVLLSYLLGQHESTFVKSFNIIIQFAAILAVVTLYKKRLVKEPLLYLKLAISFLPAAIIGLLVKNKIDGILESVQIVCWSLIVGGVVLILVDWKKKEEGGETRGLTYLHCLIIGLIQCFAFIPGVSRAAAALLGGLFVGLNRTQAAEFSFLLAIPTLGAASAYRLYSSWSQFSAADLGHLIVGGLVAYLGSLLVMKIMIGLINKFGLSPFGYYRIALGALVLLL